MTHSGIVQVSIIAGPLTRTPQPFHAEIGQQLAMNDDLHVHITPAVARQWIQILNPIAEKSN